MMIRKGSSNDAPAISALLIDLSEKYIIGSFTTEGKNNLLGSISPKAIETYFDQGYRYHVAVANIAIAKNEIVGVVATKDDSHLYHLFVHEAHQGTGIARRLWETAKVDCRSRGNPEYFTVNSSLNAQEVYKSWGFKPIAGIREGGGVKDIPMKMKADS